MLFPTTKYLRFGTIIPEHEAPWTAAFHGKGMGESPAFKITWLSAVSSPLGDQGWNAKLQRDKPGPWGAAVPTPLPHNSHHVSPAPQLHNPPCGTSQTSTKDPCPNQKGSQKGTDTGRRKKMPKLSQKTAGLMYKTKTKGTWKQFLPLL